MKITIVFWNTKRLVWRDFEDYKINRIILYNLFPNTPRYCSPEIIFRNHRISR